MLQPLQLKEVSARYADQIAELHDFLSKAGVPVGTPQALTLTAARISVDRPFHRDLISYIWVVIDTLHNRISYSDLLGVLAIAAAGPALAASADEHAAHTLLRLLMEARHSLDAAAVTPVGGPPPVAHTPPAPSAALPETDIFITDTGPGIFDLPLEESEPFHSVEPLAAPGPSLAPPPPAAALDDHRARTPAVAGASGSTGTSDTVDQLPALKPSLVNASANTLAEAASPLALARARQRQQQEEDAPRNVFQTPVPTRQSADAEPGGNHRRLWPFAALACVSLIALLAFWITRPSRQSAPAPSPSEATMGASGTAAGTSGRLGSHPSRGAATSQGGALSSAVGSTSASSASPSQPTSSGPYAPGRQPLAGYPSGRPSETGISSPADPSYSRQQASATQPANAARPQPIYPAPQSFPSRTSPAPSSTQAAASLPSFRPAPTGGGIGSGNTATASIRPAAPVIRSGPSGAVPLSIRAASKPAPAAPVAIAPDALSNRVGARTLPADISTYGIDADGRKHPELRRRQGLSANNTLTASASLPGLPGTASGNRSTRPGVVHASSEGIMSANLIYSPAPSYPAAASAAGVQGEVRVSASVDRNGNVASARIISGHPLLRDAALDAVQRWRFRPLTTGGKPLPSSATAVVEFELQ